MAIPVTPQPVQQPKSWGKYVVSFLQRASDVEYGNQTHGVDDR